LVGCALIALEIFIPSGGALGFLAAASVISAVALAFYHHGPVVGFVFVALTVVLFPASLALAIRYWPETPMGRRFLLGLPTRDEVAPDDDRQRELKALVGKIGTAKTPMLPSGAISIGGRTIDAVGQGMAIEAGQRIVVVEVTGNRVLVRPAETDEIVSRGDADDLLSQPLDSLGLDSLDDPLA
jgi:membrane-bound serine protease (ClpP class)